MKPHLLVINDNHLLRHGDDYRADNATFYSFLEGLRPHFEVTVSAPVAESAHDAGENHPFPPGLTVSPRPAYGRLWIYYLLLPFYSTLNALRLARPIAAADRVWITLPSASNGVAALLCNLLGKPHFYYVVGNIAAEAVARGPLAPIKRAISFFEQALGRWLARRSLVFALGEELQTIFRQPGNRVVPIQTNLVTAQDIVETAAARQPQREVLEIISITRLSPEKDLELAIDTVAALKRRGIPVRYRIVGKGTEPYVEGLRSRIRRYGLEEICSFEGFVSDRLKIRTLLAEADIFLLTSATEGVPKSILEAMAFGAVPVVSAVGGIPSIVANGETGILVGPRQAEAFSEAIAALANAPKRLDTIRAAARAVAIQGCREEQIAKIMRALTPSTGQIRGEDRSYSPPTSSRDCP